MPITQLFIFIHSSLAFQACTSEIKKKTGQNGKKRSKCSKMIVLPFFLVFLGMVLFRELRFFVLHSVHQNASFEQSKSTIQQFSIFSPLGGTLLVLEGSNFTNTGSRRVREERETVFETAWPKEKNGRESWF